MQFLASRENIPARPLRYLPGNKKLFTTLRRNDRKDVKNYSKYVKQIYTECPSNSNIPGKRVIQFAETNRKQRIFLCQASWFKWLCARQKNDRKTCSQISHFLLIQSLLSL